MGFGAKLMQYSPNFAGTENTPDYSVNKVLGVLNNATIETHAGAAVPHTGTELWV